MVALNNLYPQVIKVCRPLIIEDEVLKIFIKKFSECMSRSLNADPSSTVQFNLTHIADFPDGTEKGNFIGLDFSGKVFRLVYIRLKGNRRYTTLTRLYEFPEQKLTENFSRVVEYTARCVSNFTETFDICDKKTILGVASNFSIQQDSLQEGKLLHWSKEFQSQDLDQDFFTHLKSSLKKYKNTKEFYLISLVRNSTACLLSGLYTDPATRIGLFLGDDISLTYVEKYENMSAFTGDGLRTRTALEVEMKNFGDDGLFNFIKTEFDCQIDAASDNPGKFMLEKLVSATYLGEIARLCLYKLVSLGVILDGYISPGLSTKDGLKTFDMALIEMDEEKKFTRCRLVMESLGYKNVSDADCLQIRFVCRCVARRSSNLVAACLTAILQRMESKNVRIMGDGFLLKEFPNYEYYLEKKIRQLKKPELKYQINKGEKECVAFGAGLIAFIYKDGVIKFEDKQRALPPFNINKYNMTQLPASFIDCKCEPSKTLQFSPSTLKTSSKMSRESNRVLKVCDIPESLQINPLKTQSKMSRESNRTFNVYDIPEPVIARPSDICV